MNSHPDPVAEYRRNRRRTHPLVIVILLALVAGGVWFAWARGWVWWQILLAAIAAPLAAILVFAVLVLIFVLLLVKKGYRRRP